MNFAQRSRLRSAFAFLAADKGASGGAGKSLTLEERLTAAELARDTATGDLEKATKDLSAAQKQAEDSKGDTTKLQTQYDELVKVAEKAKTDLKTSQDEIVKLTSDRDALTGKLVKAEDNVTRLEKLCQLKGVDPQSAVRELSEASDNAAVYEQWKQLEKTDSGKAMAFFRSHKTELRAYAASLPG